MHGVARIISDKKKKRKDQVFAKSVSPGDVLEAQKEKFPGVRLGVEG